MLDAEKLTSVTRKNRSIGIRLRRFAAAQAKNGKRTMRNFPKCPRSIDTAPNDGMPVNPASQYVPYGRVPEANTATWMK